jgi:hypothetical protein
VGRAGAGVYRRVDFTQTAYSCARRGISLSAVGSRIRALFDGAATAARKGAVAFIRYCFWAFAHGLVRCLCLVAGSLNINYIAPLLACGIFVAVVSISLNMNYALAVEYNGKFMGYIADESIFNQAEEEVQNRIVFEDYIRPENAIGKFSIVTVRNMQLQNKISWPTI